MHLSCWASCLRGVYSKREYICPALSRNAGVSISPRSCQHYYFLIVHLSPDDTVCESSIGSAQTKSPMRRFLARFHCIKLKTGFKAVKITSYIMCHILTPKKASKETTSYSNYYL